MTGIDVLDKLIEEAQDRYHIGSAVNRSEIIAWIDSRRVHWPELRPDPPAPEGPATRN